MKKWIWISLAAGSVAAAAIITGAVHHHRAELRRQALEAALAQASAIHERLHEEYQDTMDAAAQSTLTVTENGREIGVYSLEDLGLARTAETAISDVYDPDDRLSGEDFSGLPQENRLAALDREAFEPAPVSLDAAGIDPSRVLADLEAVPRRPAVDCYPYFTNTGYVLRKEIPGTELDESVIVSALAQSLDDLYLTEEPLNLSLEITDADPYIPPEVTLENEQYDLNAMLPEELERRKYSLTVNLWGTDVTLDTEYCKKLLQVNEDGSLGLNQENASALVSYWAQRFNSDHVPYCFNSNSAGKVNLNFLTVNCRLDQAGLTSQLEDALTKLSTDPIDAPFDCTDWAGRPFSISGTYIEVDIARQTMSCFKDGSLVVSTPVVTGLPWGHMTPSGFYRVQSKEPNQWLTGEDYNVFVYYWLGIYGAYGIHDAQWRTIFGNKQYEYNGSHGCVNTPMDAMKQIYAVAEVGTPVVVFNVP